MCDKYKPSEEELKASDSFFKEMSESKCCKKSCQRPSFPERIINAGTYVRWWELALVGVAGHLVTRHQFDFENVSPLIYTSLALYFTARLIFRCR